MLSRLSSERKDQEGMERWGKMREPGLEKLTNTWVHKPDSGGINKCSRALEKRSLCARIDGTNFSDGADNRKVGRFR